MKLKALYSIVLGLSLTSCSIMSSDTTHYQDVTVRDVSFRARDNGSLKRRILILPFIDPEPNRAQQSAAEGRRYVMDLLNRSGRYNLVEHYVLPEKIQEMIKGKTEIDVEELAKKVSKYGISAVVAGKVLKVSARHVGDAVGVFREIQSETTALVRVRVVSGQSGHLMLEDKKEGVVESSMTRVGQYRDTDRQIASSLALVDVAVEEAFKETYPNILKSLSKLRWIGRVAKIVGERVFINSGRRSGLQIGDILRVTEDGQAVFDPESKAQIGVGPGRMKGTIEVRNYFGKDGAIGIVHSGAGFNPNDRLEFY